MENLHEEIDCAVTSTLSFPNEKAFLKSVLFPDLHSGQKVNDNPTTHSDYTDRLVTNESSVSRTVDISNGLFTVNINHS